MIRDSERARDDLPSGHRRIGLVLVVVLAVLAVAGAIHAGDAAHGGHECSVCDAIVSVGGAVIVAATPVAGLAAPDDVAGVVVPCHAAVREFELGRIAAARAPPRGQRGQG